MARRAARNTEERQPADQPDRPAPPPANDNRAPGAVVAAFAVAGTLALLALLSWWLLV